MTQTNEKIKMISIGIITYNHEGYIRQAIDSILAQKCNFDFEIIVGDDCSADNTQKILDEYKIKYPDKIILLINSRNSGLLNNLKNVTDRCNCKYMSICAGDDYWNDCSKLQKQVDFLEANTDYGLVHSNVNLLIGDKIQTLYKRTVPDKFIFEQLLLNNNFIYALTACYRTQLFKKYISIEEFIENNFLIEDLPMWIELSRVTKFHYMEDRLATYRIHERSLTNSSDFIKNEKILWSTYEIRAFYIKKYAIKINIKIIKQKLYYNLIKTALLNKNHEGAKKYSVKLQCMNINTFFLKICSINKSIFIICYSLLNLIKTIQHHANSLKYRLTKKNKLIQI